jgi:hypothetical protein
MFPIMQNKKNVIGIIINSKAIPVEVANASCGGGQGIL